VRRAPVEGCYAPAIFMEREPSVGVQDLPGTVRQGFESPLLHRRVCKPSVPREIRVTPENSGGGRPSLLREAEIVSRLVAFDGERVTFKWMDYRAKADARYKLMTLDADELRSGQLVRVLEDWSPFSDGLFLYYPGHRQVPVALRALTDMLHAARSAAPTRGLLEIPFAAD
jgi:hypothetical protein